MYNFADVDSAKWVAIASGVILLVLSYLTDYEGGGKKTVSMDAHLTMGIILGIFLATSPWLFNFDEYVYLPHLIVGILEIGAGLLIEQTSGHSLRNHIDGNISPAH